jgi:hypothetical protein
MSDPAAITALPGLIRAVRATVDAHKPANGFGRAHRAALLGLLIYAEITAEMLVEAIPADARPPRPPQQYHAPLGDHFEPRVPRRAGTDPRLPAGRHHP